MTHRYRDGIMRLTVGPLPPAVYWRRRAIVLGALLVVVVLLYAACGGSGGSSAGQKNAAATATPSAGQPSGSPEATSTIVVPSNLPTSEPAEPDPTVPAAPDPEPQPPPASGAQCTNEEMTLTPMPAKTSMQRGTPIDLRLRIANSSSRTCERDVGADLQESRLVQGAQTIWSSDHCGAARGSDLRTFGPGGSREYMVT